MTQFEQVSVTKQANVYFEGRVTSRTVWFPDGSKKTLGIALPGEYEFATALKEEMEILSGQLEIRLPGETAWQTVTAPAVFSVPAHAKFGMRVQTVVDYCCSYLAE